MTNDAKLGLVAGVGLVIVVAVVFFRKDLTPDRPGGENPVVATPATAPRVPGRGSPRPVRATTTTRSRSDAAVLNAAEPDAE